MTETCKMNQLANSFSLLELDVGDDREVTIVPARQENANGKGKPCPNHLSEKIKSCLSSRTLPSIDPFPCVLMCKIILHATLIPIISIV